MQWKLVINDPIPFADLPDPDPVPSELQQRYYTEQLYDLDNDPGELHDVLLEHRDIANALRKRVWQIQPRGEETASGMPIDDTVRQRLKTLGYVD